MADSEDWKSDVGELLLVGFEGTSLTPALTSYLNDGNVGGVVLFARNIESVEQVTDLNHSIYEASSRRIPFVAVDQEGGPVQRIREPLPHWPPMRVLGEIGDADLCARLGEAMGDELAELGFNLDFAPCADVDSNPENPIIAERAFSSNPVLVARYAGAFAAGLTISGIVPCAKHFPGHGDTAVDSHLDLPRIEKTLDELRRLELIPFRALSDANVPMVMTAHILFEAIDTEHPATLSERAITELLRLEIGYDRIVISDDLEMKAVADAYDIPTLVELGLRAGVDIFLICRSEEKWMTAYESLIRLGERDQRMRQRIRQAAARVRRVRSAWLKPWNRAENPLEAMSLAAHFELLEEIQRRHREHIS